MSVGRSDGSHKADPSFHAITKVPRILEALTVLVMGTNKGVNETHHHDKTYRRVITRNVPVPQVLEDMRVAVRIARLSHG